MNPAATFRRPHPACGTLTTLRPQGYTTIRESQNAKPGPGITAVKPLRFLFVGQAKAPFYRQAEDHYLDAIGHSIATVRVVVKDARSGNPEDRRKAEGKAVLERLGARDFPVVLDGRGKMYDSPALAARLGVWVEDPGRAPCFIVGGAYGLSGEVLARAGEVISLGPGTLPHELARVVLLEQIYRGMAILRGAPYHH
ncbi:lsu m3 [hydrocarbon metagenome]|uniref:Lsu m3 n=1 Tax=hydrocarbon metagenome TaxID=938273 RepID=A0A0W8G2E2_9ZZZZ